ncbi:phosphatase PAP2 family protein [Rhizobium sp. Pop5]|uniref:phosphatase PAP2 family protein n=1 Tax=Rhizobium sp. Pop5 TaxID=1223565 RepID=UPI000283C316|nr:phosphatase PAP2 family protein [Rhizobium sp. Pop5]EJZ23085.1 transmembrane protein [Rhizobium sp. Pop5]UVD58012.1 phosphatase PAP2 family protein [Rhizobium sp. Pop5]
MTVFSKNRWRHLAIRLPKTTFGAFMLLFWTWWALLVAFRAFPGIDIFFSRLFFVAADCDAAAAPGSICGGFPYRDSATFDLLRTAFFRLPYIVAIVMAWKLIECYQQHGATFNAERARKLKVALGTLLIGPVLLVNVILKEHWGRPRPVQTDIFGGALHFAEAGSLAGKCVSNCSFVSGEAASAGWLFCLLLFVPKSLRYALFPPLVAISILTPAMRLSFGAHYLSDVVLGWLSSLVVFAALLALTESQQSQKNSEI